MQAAPLSSPDQRGFLLLVTSAWTLGGVTLYLLAPRTAPVLLPISIVAPVAWHWAIAGRVPWQQPAPVIVLLLLAGLYLLINGTWSLSPASAYLQIASLFVYIGALYTTLNTVREAETLYTPFGAVEAFHLQPRRITRPGGDLTAEIWFAPSLAYLPARIRIRQDADTYIDLMLRRKPQLAAN